MVINRERDVCYGRGFNQGHADEGFWENFTDWVVRTPVASPASKVTGGPGWYIIDDQSTASPDPYIVISNHTAGNVAANPNRYNEPHKILKCGYNTTEAGTLRIEAYLWWDAAAHVGYGRWASKRMENYDAANFVYDFRGGPEIMLISSRLGALWTHVLLADWEGDANLVDGTHVVGVVQSGLTAGSNVLIQLAPGQAANFTEGHYAWLYDFEGHDWCDYVRVDDVDAYHDRITINKCSQNFPAGSVIGAYVHRYCIINYETLGFAGAPGGWTDNDKNMGVQIPYVSRYGYEMQKSTSAIYVYCSGDVLDGAIGSGATLPTVPGMAPNDRGQFACQRPVIYEQQSAIGVSADDMNRGYGPVKNVWITCKTNMLQMTDGRRINNLNHVYLDDSNHFNMSGKSDQAVLIPDYDSVV